MALYYYIHIPGHGRFRKHNRGSIVLKKEKYVHLVHLQPEK